MKQVGDIFSIFSLSLWVFRFASIYSIALSGTGLGKNGWETQNGTQHDFASQTTWKL